MKKIVKISISTIGIILIILIVTNPTNRNFAEFLHSKSVPIAEDPLKVQYRYGRHKNYLIFSIYYYNCYQAKKRKSIFGEYYMDYGKSCERYFGVCKNFFKINT
jgi:hypothetical protein